MTWADSGRDRSDQRLDSDDVHDPCQIVSQYRECHLGGYFWKRFSEEVRRSHAGLHRAERMLDCLATLAQITSGNFAFEFSFLSMRLYRHC